MGRIMPYLGMNVKRLRHETEFAFFQYRTQLKNPADIENVKRVQAGYKVRPLSAYLGQPAPKAAPPAAEALRGLVDAVPADNELRIELKGDLAAMLSGGSKCEEVPLGRPLTANSDGSGGRASSLRSRILNPRSCSCASSKGKTELR
jgi:hypothetical protein